MLPRSTPADTPSCLLIWSAYAFCWEDNAQELLGADDAQMQGLLQTLGRGTLTVTEMLREVTAEDQAKQAKALHEIQRLQALYDIKYTMNH